MENVAKKSFFQKCLPHVVALVVFMVISMLYFKPQYDDMAIRQGDMVQVSGMGKDVKDHQEAYGENPGWTGNMFGGMPSYLIDFPFEGRVIRDIANEFYIIGLPASFIFIAMAGFYFMLLCFGVNPWLSIVGGVAYGFSTYFLVIIEAGHITKMVALAYVAPMIGAVFLAYRKNLWLGVVLTGIFASIEIAANHVQITYYFAFVLLALVINELVRAIKEKLIPKFVKTSVLLLFAGMLAIGSNAVLLWYVNDYSKHTIRGGSELTVDGGETTSGLDKEYATAWSYGKMETFNLFIPNFMGGSSAGGFSSDGEVADALAKYNARNMASTLPAYWGAQPMTSGPVYIGAVVIFLFILGMFLLCGDNKWWIAGVTGLSILLAWGHNLMWFTDLFFNYFPLYHKFRTVSMTLVIAECMLPLLGILALQKIWERGVSKEKFLHGLKYSVIISGGVAILFIIFGSTLFDFSSAVDAQLPEDVAAAMRLERASMLRTDAIRSLIFVLLSAGVVWAFFADKIKRAIFVVAMVALVLFDMIPVDMRFLNYETFMPAKQAQTITPTSANLQIMADTTKGYRVANLSLSTFNDATTSYFHRSVGGYHAAKLRRYQDVIDRHLSKMNMRVYDMLNTKYFITPNNEGGEPIVQLNPNALGVAWFVNSVEFVNNANEEIAAMDNFDPRTTAIVDKRFEPLVKNKNIAADSTATIALTNYKPNKVTYKYNSATDGIAVFSEIFYEDGWTAYIDNVEAPYFRADYILRAMDLPAGDHTVVFEYKVPNYGVLVTISYIASILLLLALVVVIAVQGIKRKR